ncbi:hypothetical protein ATKI12_5076 [Kitasatospora sp. Ki12]
MRAPGRREELGWWAGSVSAGRDTVGPAPHSGNKAAGRPSLPRATRVGVVTAGVRSPDRERSGNALSRSLV